MSKKLITIVKVKPKSKPKQLEEDPKITRRRLMRLQIRGDFIEKYEFLQHFNKLPADAIIRYIGHDFGTMYHYYAINSKEFKVVCEGYVVPTLQGYYKDGKLDHYEW